MSDKMPPVFLPLTIYIKQKNPQKDGVEGLPDSDSDSANDNDNPQHNKGKQPKVTHPAEPKPVEPTVPFWTRPGAKAPEIPKSGFTEEDFPELGGPKSNTPSKASTKPSSLQAESVWGKQKFNLAKPVVPSPVVSKRVKFKADHVKSSKSSLGLTKNLVPSKSLLDSTQNFVPSIVITEPTTPQLDTFNVADFKIDTSRLYVPARRSNRSRITAEEPLRPALGQPNKVEPKERSRQVIAEEPLRFTPRQPNKAEPPDYGRQVIVEEELFRTLPAWLNAESQEDEPGVDTDWMFGPIPRQHRGHTIETIRGIRVVNELLDQWDLSMCLVMEIVSILDDKPTEKTADQVHSPIISLRYKCQAMVTLADISHDETLENVRLVLEVVKEEQSRLIHNPGMFKLSQANFQSCLEFMLSLPFNYGVAPWVPGETIETLGLLKVMLVPGNRRMPGNTMPKLAYSL